VVKELTSSCDLGTRLFAATTSSCECKLCLSLQAACIFQPSSLPHTYTCTPLLSLFLFLSLSLSRTHTHTHTHTHTRTERKTSLHAYKAAQSIINGYSYPALKSPGFRQKAPPARLRKSLTCASLTQHNNQKTSYFTSPHFSKWIVFNQPSLYHFLPSTFEPSNLPTFQPSNLPTFQPSNLQAPTKLQAYTFKLRYLILNFNKEHYTNALSAKVSATSNGIYNSLTNTVIVPIVIARLRNLFTV
jgi:hypothetical protein